MAFIIRAVYSTDEKIHEKNGDDLKWHLWWRTDDFWQSDWKRVTLFKGFLKTHKALPKLSCVLSWMVLITRIQAHTTVNEEVCVPAKESGKI